MSASEGMSKSAKKRANQKARAAEAAVAEPPAPPAKAAAAPPAKAAAKGKAKAEPKPAATPKAEPKAAKAAAPKPEPKQEAKAAAKSKANAKSKAKAKAEPAPKEEEKEDRAGPLVYYEIDDGSRQDEWAVSSGKTKQQEKQAKRQEEKKAMEAAQKSGAVLQAKGSQHIPGLAPAEVQIAQAKGKAGAKAKAAQGVTAVIDVSKIAAANKDAAPTQAAPVSNDTSVVIKVPENKIGWIVGPKGANINLIKEKTGIKTLDMAGGDCTIIGGKDAVAMAEIAVNQLLEKGYCSLQYDDYEEDGVMCHPTIFPDLIGKGGCIIQEIKKQAKCEVSIPAVPKTGGPAAKKYRVGLAGSKASVALGKEIVNSIAMYGHHQLIHPGQEHKELEIEQWRYPFIIGSKGSELRHIQNSFKVKVNIPREHSLNENVVIVGEPSGIERAVKHIEKILYEAEQPRGRGAQEKATDDWGDEGEVEDWMKPYMYKR